MTNQEKLAEFQKEHPDFRGYVKFANAERIPQELINKALEWSVLDYFNRFEPNILHQVGSTYRRRDHPSFVVSADGWLYTWHSKGLNGKGALNYLRNVEHIQYKLSGGNCRSGIYAGEGILEQDG